MQRPDYLYHPSGVRYGKGGGCQTQKQPPPGNSAVTDPPLGLHIKDIVIHILPRVRCRRLDRKGDRFALGHRRPPLKENFVPHIMVCGRAKKMHCRAEGSPSKSTLRGRDNAVEGGRKENLNFTLTKCLRCGILNKHLKGRRTGS